MMGWHERLASVAITNDDAFTHVDRIADRSGVVIYADPPYFKKGDQYVHDAPSDDAGKRAWHTALRDLLASKKRARVIVSYYDHPFIREIYAGWTCIEIYKSKALAQQGMREKTGEKYVSPEILLINGPSLSGRGLFG